MGTAETESRGKALCAVSKPLGDSVCLLPELRWLAEKQGGKVDVLVKTNLQAELYRGTPFIGRIIQLEHWRFPFWLSPRQLRLIANIRSRGYGQAYLFFETDPRKSRKFRRMLSLAGVKKDRITEGFPEVEKPVFLNLPSDARPAYRLSPILEVAESEKEILRGRLEQECNWRKEPLVILHPGNNLAAKGRGGQAGKDPRWWPAENWRQVMRGILAESGAIVILTGSEAEKPLNQSIIQSEAAAAARIFNWAGRLSLRQLIALLSLADSCVSIDTGVAHAAPAAGCPTLGLFGPRDPRSMDRCGPKGWGPTFTLRGVRDYPPKRKYPEGWRHPSELVRDYMTRIRPLTVVRLWKELPKRLPDPGAADCLIRHYCEGEEEPEIRRVESF